MNIKNRPFMFRIHAAEFFAEVQKMSDRQRGTFLTQFATDLITLSPALDYSKHVIQQTVEYIEKQSANGKLGGRPKKSDGKAVVKRPSSDAKATPKPNESHNKNKNIKEENIKEEKTTFESSGTRGKLISVAPNVQLSESETEKFISERGKDFYLKCIDVLNNYKGSTGKKYKDDNLAIRSWVIDKVIKEHGTMRNISNEVNF